MGLKGYKRPILMDVDGVLANFTKKFTSLCYTIDTQYPIVTHPNASPHWNFKNIPEHVQAQAWEIIRQSPYWWIQMEPLLTPYQFQRLNAIADVVYVSSREGFSVAWQTNTWLRGNGIEHPNVLIVPTGNDKADLVSILKARVIVDDRPRTLEALRLHLAFLGEYPVTILAPKYPYNAGKDGIVYYTNPDAMLEMLA